jgi:hypothetical protein
MKGHRLLLLCATVFFACASPYYKYNNVQYDNPESALAAEHRDLDAALAAVQPVNPRLGGRAKVVLPNHDRIRQVGIKTTGNPPPEMITFLVDGLSANFPGMAEGFKKSDLFDSASISEIPATDNPPMEDFDYLVWLDIDAMNLAQ